MRTKPRSKKCIAVVEQMLWGNGGGNWAIGLPNIVNRLAGGGMLKNNSKLGMTIAQSNKVLLNESRLTIEDIDLR